MRRFEPWGKVKRFAAQNANHGLSMGGLQSDQRCQEKGTKTSGGHAV
jgi:hypothetical protein